MKTFCILLIALLAASIASSQSCLPEGIRFHNQAEIDSFQINYPDCTEIEGNVTISGSDIINLNGLNVLISIEGYLLIVENDTLTSLAGLDNVTFIGGELMITNNSSLSNCEAQWLCDYLSSPNGSINIYGNDEGCNNPPEVAGACGIGLLCLPYGNYYFHSQSDIDDFQYDYPDCTELEGNVEIWDKNGDEITNLNGLAGITSIGGELIIFSNYLLTSLTGLDNVISIGGDLWIRSNETLTSLEGLQNVTFIGGGLDIYYNDALTSLMGLEGLMTVGAGFVIHDNGIISLMGLEGLTAIGAGMRISNNTALTSPIGLEGLTSIGGNLDILANPSLTSLTGLESLSSIGGDLSIINNYALTGLMGLDNVVSIGGGLDIFYNPALTCLTGLDNIDAGSIKNLFITSNPNLSKCEIQSVCDYLACPGGNILIGCNAPGCNSPEEVLAACETISVEDVIPESSFSIYSNPASFQITIETSILPQKNTYLALYDLNGRQLIKKQIMRESTVVDASSLPRGIYILKLTDNRTIQVAKLIKQ